MTVIVCDRTQMSGDTQVTAGGVIARHCKVHRVRTGCLAAYAGTATQGITWVKWLKKGAKQDEIPEASTKDEEGFNGLILAPEGIYLYEDISEPGILLLDDFFAIGDGAEIALSAMHQGLSTKDAALAASRVLATCNDEIITMRLKKDARGDWIY